MTELISIAPGQGPPVDESGSRGKSRRVTWAWAYRLSRVRFAVPMIILSSALGMLVNEVTFRSAVNALGTARALMDPGTRLAIEDALWINWLTVSTLTLLGAIALSFYIRHLRLFDQERAERQQDLEAQIDARTAELRELARNLLTAREDEKAHLARELHDELGGLLTAAKLDVARMRAKLSSTPALLERLDSINARLNEGISLKRRVVEDLRPSALDTLGLEMSLGILCTEVGERAGIEVRTDFQEVKLSANGKLAVYRLVQEALTNVSKYARASRVLVTVKQGSDGVRVFLEDDGVGFDPALAKSATHGIAGMRFRIETLGGTMSVTSQPGAGTQLVAVLPATGGE